jgi:hypothetical protein
MTQVIVRWDGGDWPLDTEEVELAQAFVIKGATVDEQFPAGRNLGAWELGMKNCEPGCVRALYWLMLQQSGMISPIAKVPDSFAVLKFHRAWAEAAEAAVTDPEELERGIANLELRAEILRKTLSRVRAEAEEDPAGPTSLPGSGRRRSAAHGSRTVRETGTGDAASEPGK